MRRQRVFLTAAVLFAGLALLSVIYLILSSAASHWYFYLTLPLFLVAALFGGFYFTGRHTATKMRQKSTGEVTQGELIQQDIAAIKQLFSQAVAEIEQKYPDAKSGLYDKPWYLMIGTEKEGKSSFLKQNLLEPMLSKSPDPSQSQYLSFWWNEQQLIIEVGNRIFDNDGADTPLWNAMMQQLMKHRPRQAINGVIYNIGADSLATNDLQKLTTLAQEARTAVLALTRYCQLNIPVYCLVSQADTLADFTGYFESYEASARDNPLGIRLDQGPRVKVDGDALEAACEQLLKDLATQQIQHMQVARNAQESQAVMALPYQLDQLMSQIRHFIETLSYEKHQRKAVWIRGFFFASTYRKGKSHDLLSGRIARDLGFNLKAPEETPQQRRSLFASHWISRVLLPEAGLVKINVPRTRIYQIGRLSIFVLILAILGLFSNHLLTNWNRYLAFEAEARHTLSDYRQQMADMKQPDTSQVIAPLMDLRNLYEMAKKQNTISQLVSPGMENLIQNIEEAYQKQLQIWLFPRLEYALNRSMRQSLAAADAQREFELMRYYQMLYETKQQDYSALELFMLNTLEQQNLILPTQKADLALLMDDMLNASLPVQYPRDEPLVRRIAVELQGIAPDRLIYQRLQHLAPWNEMVDIRNQFGSAFDTVFGFTRQFEGYLIPLLYTRAGYTKLDLTPESKMLRQLAGEYKALLQDDTELTRAQMVELSDRLQNLYFADYIRHWKNLANNIVVKPMPNNQALFDALTRLSSNDNNPLIEVLDTISSNTHLAKVGLGAQNSVKTLLSKKAPQNDEMAEQAQKLVHKTLVSAQPAYAVDDAFAEIHQYVAKGKDEKGQPTAAPLDQLLATIKQTDTTIDLANREADSDKALYDWAKKQVTGHAEGVLSANDIKQAAPAPVNTWVNQFQSILWKYVLGATMNYINQQWYENVFQVYQENLADRFPLTNTGRGEASLKNFTEFFRPQGIVDEFVKDTLAPFVQNQHGQWKLTKIHGQTAPINQAVLRQLDHIHNIRDLFFGESQKLSLPLQLKAISMTTGATHFDLTADQKIFGYNQGPRIWVDLAWPVDSQTNAIKATFYNNAGILATKNYPGSWGLLRFLFSSHELVQPDAGNQVTIDYRNEDQTIRLQYRVKNQDTRLSPELFQQLRLPSAF